MRNIFAREVEKMMGEDKDIVFMTAECGFNVVEPIAEKYPDRFYNLGIAEQSLVGTAAGVALQGMKPVAYTMAAFLSMRAYEQIRVDVAYQNLPVVLASVIPGLGYGNSGPTHHSIEDAALMRVLPNMTVVYPSCAMDVIAAAHQLIGCGRPCYIGLGRAPADYCATYLETDFKVGKAIQVRDGHDAAILANGVMVSNAVKAAEILQTEGLSVRVINMHTIKPLDVECIERSIAECGVLITVEESSVIGGLGGAVAEYLAERREKNYQFRRLGIPDTYGEVIGTQAFMQKKYQIDAEGIARKIRELCDGRSEREISKLEKP